MPDLTTLLSKFLTQLYAGSISFPVSGTTLTETAQGQLTVGSPGAANGLRVNNGAGPEYGSMEWNSNFFNVGNITNGGTAGHYTRVISGTNGGILIAPGGNDQYSFLQGGPIKFSNLTTVQRGVPCIVAYGRATGQTAANASVATFTVGAADGTFEVSANVLITTATTFSFSVQVTYTDEGNTARTQTMLFGQPGSATSTTLANAAGAVPYVSYPMMIRAKAATAITVITQASGTYTTVTYNIEGLIKQLV